MEGAATIFFVTGTGFFAMMMVVVPAYLASRWGK